MDWRVLLLAGTLLTVAGPATPALWGGRQQAVVIMDLGQRGASPRRLAAELQALAAVRGFESRVMAPGALEVRGPAEKLTGLVSWAQEVALPADPAVACADGTCAPAALGTTALFNRPSGPMDPPAVEDVPARRSAWLLGMAVGLLGVALTVLALMRRPLVQAAVVPWCYAALGALVGLLAGLGWASARPAVVEQVLVVKPAQRPRLPDEPLTRDALEETHRVVARLGGPGFPRPNGVTLHPMAMGNGLVVHAAAPDASALAGLLEALRTRVVQPDAQATAAALALVDLPWEASGEAQRGRIRAELQMPSVVARPVEPDSRGPLVLAPWMVLVGALLGFAARPRTR